MGITVKEAMQLPELKDTRLIAGKEGIHNEIRWITIVEIMEDATRLHEGEFLITTAFGLKDDQNHIDHFIEKLANQKLSGVAIHTGFYLDVVPQRIIEAANEKHLPLIEIPRMLNFSTITRGILEQIVNRQMKLLSYSQQIQEALTELVLKNEGMPSITVTLAKLLGGNVEVRDVKDELIDSYQTKSKTEHEFLNPIIAGEQKYGTIIVRKDSDFTPLDYLAIKQAATVYSLEFLKLRIVEETRTYVHADFLDDLLSNNYESEEVILNRGKELGYNLSSYNRVTVLLADDLDYLEKILRELLGNNVTSIIKRKLDHIIMLTVNENEKDKKIEEIIKTLSENEKVKGLHIGCGDEVKGISSLTNSLQEAHHSLLFAIYRGIRSLLYKDLGAYKLFIQLKEKGENLESYYLPLLEPLIEYDRTHKSQLLKTFEAFVENNLIVNRTAEKLFIHRHTLNYRLKQIINKTGVNIHHHEERIHLQFALMAYQTDQILST
ncbi:PucR family transcriptional regulator [Pseudalkalibacillus caeni]|uniref:PucR family transcriptional regulator n=1 Tax=Exobacillus caeni TaxID=2574798 RepID=A0A5R9F786_9BACL|nr:PucR family transcriptional regulator [Pseudalkalibacillus caeni]TLS37488.1 hypothetical protein FCL54_10100 [Pseudalkalibacillus caeni]